MRHGKATLQRAPFTPKQETPPGIGKPVRMQPVYERPVPKRPYIINSHHHECDAEKADRKLARLGIISWAEFHRRWNNG